MEKTLVVYYSRKGYAEKAALQAAKDLNCDFLEIDTIENTAGYGGFFNCIKMGAGKKEAILFPYDTVISDYDKIIICSSVWMGDVAAPMKEFIKKERHNIKRAEYILLHGFPDSYENIPLELDKILRLKHEKFTSIQCGLGKFHKVQEFFPEK